MPIIMSSNGNDDGWAFTIADTGKILECHNPSGFSAEMLGATFDVVEFVKTYGKLDGVIDILDIGYTLPSGFYEVPDAEFRKEVASHGKVPY
jgi:hypothetical protein